MDRWMKNKKHVKTTTKRTMLLVCACASTNTTAERYGGLRKKKKKIDEGRRKKKRKCFVRYAASDLFLLFFLHRQKLEELRDIICFVDINTKRILFTNR
jgi:hypothetical protein